MSNLGSYQPRPVTTPKSAVGKHFGPYGCHIELAAGEAPDDCVLNYDAPADCRFGHTESGRVRRHPHTCPYWKPIISTDGEGRVPSSTTDGGQASGMNPK